MVMDAAIWLNIITLGLVFVGLVTVLATISISRTEQRSKDKEREENLRPYLIVEVKVDQEKPREVHVVLQNIGRSAAKNVTLNFPENKPKRFGGGVENWDEIDESSPIFPTFLKEQPVPPGFYFENLLGLEAMKNQERAASFKAIVEYESVLTARKYRDEYIVNPLLFGGFLGSNKTLKEENLEKLVNKATSSIVETIKQSSYKTFP
jgi:hypothetical protein